MRGQINEVVLVTERRLRHALMAVSALTMTGLVLEAGLRSDGTFHFSLFDDAMISMAYAENLYKHGELVWNFGAPRVEGISNPLWTIWMFVLHVVSPHSWMPPLLVSLSGVGVMIAIANVIRSILVRIIVEEDEVAPLLAMIGTLLCYPLILWTLRGMEVGFISLIALLVLREVVVPSPRRSALRIAFLVALGVFTRNDFLVFVFGFVFGLVLDISCDRQDRVVRVRAARLLFASGMISLLLVMAAQKIYWGDWLPNTFYLKMGGTNVPARLGRGLTSASQTLPWVMFVSLSGFVGSRRSPTRRGRLALLTSSSVVALMQIYSIYVGGDAWETYTVNRFLATVLPFACLNGVLWVRTVVTSPNKIADLVVVLSPLALIPVQLFGVDWVPRSQASFYFLVLPLICGMALVATCVINSRTDPIELNERQRIVLGMCGALLVVVGSASLDGSARHLFRQDPLHSDTNQTVSQEFVAVEDVTKSGASIAVVWAGVTGYATERKLIDLLGKNDPKIARMNVRGRIHPGHDKWDYDYSIGVLRPDVIFQLWREESEPRLYERLAGWGYVRMCSTKSHFPRAGVWVNRNSRNVNFGYLRPCSYHSSG